MAELNVRSTMSKVYQTIIYSIRSFFSHLNVHQRLLILITFTLLSMLIFMVINIQGNLEFVMTLRAKKIATFVLVGYAIAVSTLLFQTATGNRILTPAIMGFDALYVLLQSALIFYFGSKFAVQINPQWMFIFEVSLMIIFSGLLYWFLFAANRSIHQLVLTGVVIGVLFQSLSSFIQRIIDPNEFNFLQDRFFASFNNPDQNLLLIATITVVLTSIYGLRKLHIFDVMSLGRDNAISLGIDYKKQVIKILLTVAILVSVSTALVGPVTFFGLLVVHLAYLLINSYQHKYLIPAAVLIAVMSLIFGQLLLEQFFSFDTNLRVIIDFLGGIIFVYLLMRRKSA